MFQICLGFTISVELDIDLTLGIFANFFYIKNLFKS